MNCISCGNTMVGPVYSLYCPSCSSKRAEPPAPPVVERPSWDEVNIEIAKQVARRTTCTRALELGGVGAVLVEAGSNRILGTGYCGSLPGQPHCTDVGCLKIGDDPGCHRSIHAEQNAILFARDFPGPKTLYTTISPCIKCLQFAIVKGVQRIVFSRKYRISEPQEELCRSAGVAFYRDCHICHHQPALRDLCSACLPGCPGCAANGQKG